MRLNKGKMILAAAALSAVCTLSAADAPAPAPAAAKPVAAAPAPEVKAKTLDEMLAFLPDTVAECDGIKITKKNIIQRLQDMKVPMAQLSQIPESQFKVILKRIAENMLIERIMLKKAEAAGFAPTEEFAKKFFTDKFNALPKEQQEQAKAQIKKDISEFIAEQAKNETQRNFIALNAYMEKLYKLNLAKVSDADVEKFYADNKEKEFKQPETVTAAHILILANGMTPDNKKMSEEDAKKQDAEAQKKIQDIQARLQKGEDFGKLAEEFSECPSGKANKGSLGPFTKGQMVPEFEKAAFALQKDGEISPIVKTVFGYHIIKRISKSNESYIPLNDQLKKGIKEAIAGKALDEIIRKDTDALKTSGKMKFFGFDIPEEKPAAAPAPAPAPVKK